MNPIGFAILWLSTSNQKQLDICGFEWNVLALTRWISVQFATDIHVSLRIEFNNAITEDFSSILKQDRLNVGLPAPVDTVHPETERVLTIVMIKIMNVWYRPQNKPQIAGRKCYQCFPVLSCLTHDRCWRNVFPPGYGWNCCLWLFIIQQPWPLYHPVPLSQGMLEHTITPRASSELRSGDSFTAHFLGNRVFNRPKCQVGSFCPAVCLLSFTEPTICWGMCSRGRLSRFSSSHICSPVPRVVMYG